MLPVNELDLLELAVRQRLALLLYRLSIRHLSAIDDLMRGFMLMSWPCVAVIYWRFPRTFEGQLLVCKVACWGKT